MKKCIKCGCELTETDLFCRNCGAKQEVVEKSSDKQLLVWRVVSAVLLVLCIVFGVSASQAKQDYEEVQGLYQNVLEKNTELESQISAEGDNADKIARLQSELDSLDISYQGLYEEYSKVVESLNFYQEQVDFMNEYVVIIDAREDAMKKYHTYNCPNWKAADGSWSIFIYNIDMAIQEHYTACEDCH